MRRILQLAAAVALVALGAKATAFSTQAAETATPAKTRADSADIARADVDPQRPRFTLGAAPAPIGPAFDSGAAMPAHAVPIASYTMRATLDEKKHDIHGEGTITWKNPTSTYLDEIYVHLYLNAFKNSRTYFQRFNTGGFRGSADTKDWGWIEVKKFHIHDPERLDDTDLWPGADKHSPNDPDDETDIRVPVPNQIGPNATVTFDVAWDEHLPEVTFRTGYFGSFHMVGQWFPKIAKLEPDGVWAHFPFHHLSEFYADFGNYDVTLDTPEGYVVGATGKLESETHENGRAKRRFVQNDVHDFSWTAWNEFREKTATSEAGVALRALYPPGFDDAAEIELDTVRYGLDYLGKAYGKYPYGTLTIVHPPDGAEEAGGMEYPTLITTGGPAWVDATGLRIFENVTIHELGHQWFYGLVATNENAWPFLDEGINSYAEADSLDARYHDASVGHVLGMPVSEDAYFRAEAADVERDAPVASAAPDFANGRDYGALVYQRTGTILLTLGRVYGQDLVRRAIGRYARRYRFEHPGPEAVIEAVSEVVSKEAGENLRAALFDMATVDYRVDDIVSAPAAAPRGIFGDPSKPSEAPKEDEEGFEGSALVRRIGELRFPVEVHFVADDGSVQRVVWDAKENAERLPYKGKSKLVAVVIDPEHKVLLDDNLANNARRVTPGSFSATTLERALFTWEAALAGAGP